MPDIGKGRFVPDIGRLDRITVPFAGEGAGVEGLTWGQQAVWKDLRETGWTLNLSDVAALPPATTTEEFAGEIGSLVSRHPSMRTRLGFDADGRPLQVVSNSGAIPLDVVDLDDDDDPAERSSALAIRSLLTAFDYETEWPLRIALIRRHGVLLYWAWTLCHLVIDGMGIAVLLEGDKPAEAAGRMPSRGPAMSLLELARWERTPAARRQSDASMRYWETQLRAAPAAMPVEPANPGGHQGERHWYVRSHSPATYLAVQAIAARTRTDTARVLLAVFAVAVARVAGINPVVTRVVVSNRFRPGFARILAPLSQIGLLSVDVADTTVDEVIARARRGVPNAAKHAYYDPTSLDDLITRIGRERGRDARVRFLYNDRRVYNRLVADEAAGNCTVTLEQIRSALPESTVRWDGSLDQFNDRLSVSIEDQPETVAMSVSVDTHYMHPADVETFLRTFEGVAVEAAFDTAVPTRVSSAPIHA